MIKDPKPLDFPEQAPASTPEGREHQLISMAMDLAEQRLRDGTASAQEVTHFLRLGSANARLEMKKLEQENRLLEAKIEALESQKHTEALYAEALRAMRTYSGQAQDG